MLALCVPMLLAASCVADDEKLEYAVTITADPATLLVDGTERATLLVSVVDQYDVPIEGGAVTLYALTAEGLTGAFQSGDESEMIVYLDVDGVGSVRFRCTEAGSVWVRAEATFLTRSGSVRIECEEEP